MHALSFFHEHERADRDEYITVHEENVQSGWLSQLNALLPDEWTDSGHPFELGSVMIYGSSTRAVGDSYTMTLNTGGIWGHHSTLTTTDALQVQWHFCRQESGFNFKETKRQGLRNR